MQRENQPEWKSVHSCGEGGILHCGGFVSGFFFLSSVKKTWDARALFIYTTTSNRTLEWMSAVARGFWVGTLVLRDVLVRMEFSVSLSSWIFHISVVLSVFRLELPPSSAVILKFIVVRHKLPTQSCSIWDSTINYFTFCSCNIASKSNVKNSTW